MQTQISDAVCWKNTGEIEAEKQPTSRSPNNDCLHLRTYFDSSSVERRVNGSA